MISLDLMVSGGHLGRALAQDPEECAYALVEIASVLDDGDVEVLAGHILDAMSDPGAVAAFLRKLADTL